jgi:hypothetical protein
MTDKTHRFHSQDVAPQPGQKQNPAGRDEIHIPSSPTLNGLFIG